MKYVQYYLNNKTQLAKLVIPVVGTLVLLLFVFLYYIPRTEGGVKSFYAGRLNKLATYLNDINHYEDINNPANSLKTYDTKLSGTLLVCKDMDGKYKQIRKKKFKKSIQDTVEGTQKLCTDLEPVLSYSKDLYTALGPYITDNTSTWPAYENPDFTSHLNQTQDLIHTTLAKLDKIHYPKLDDPALAELITQIKSADKLVADADKATAKKNAVQAQAITEQLRKDMQQDKADLLNARGYFWQNTVQLDALQKAISHLQEHVKS